MLLSPAITKFRKILQKLEIPNSGARLTIPHSAENCGP